LTGEGGNTGHDDEERVQGSEEMVVVGVVVG
jgi:hypothetical protein